MKDYGSCNQMTASCKSPIGEGIFKCKLTTPASRGDLTRRCYVVARHVNRENGGRTAHFGGQCSFPLICSRCNISVLLLFTVTFDEFGALANVT